MLRTVGYICRRRIPCHVLAALLVYAFLVTLLTAGRLLWYGRQTSRKDVGSLLPSIHDDDDSYSLTSGGGTSSDMSIDQMGNDVGGHGGDENAKVAANWRVNGHSMNNLTLSKTGEYAQSDTHGRIDEIKSIASSTMSKGDNRVIPQGQLGCLLNGRPVIRKELDCRKRLPDVLGIGIEKCGTTALTFFLTMHPSLVHSDPKEVYFWNRPQNREKGLEWYRKLMPLSSKYQVTMEFTPSYIFDPDAPWKIKDAIPRVKFIVMVRDPVVRAVSHYLHVKHYNWSGLHRYRTREEGEPARAFLNGSFATTVIKPDGNVFEDNAIIENGLYEVHLRRWLGIFPRSQFLVIDEGVFRRDPLPILRQVEQFLGLPTFFDGDKIYFDKRKGLFCRRTSGQSCLGDLKGRQHPTVREDVLRKLTEYYHPHNEKLKELLNRNLSWTN